MKVGFKGRLVRFCDEGYVSDSGVKSLSMGANVVFL